MIEGRNCSVCDDCVDVGGIKKNEDVEHNEEISFAILFALVPAMTMTLFNLMGFV